MAVILGHFVSKRTTTVSRIDGDRPQQRVTADIFKVLKQSGWSANKGIQQQQIEVNEVSSTNKYGKKFIFLTGPPGSGKRTQCQAIENEFGVVHIAFEELLLRV